jgi:hypothetical protein
MPLVSTHPVTEPRTRNLLAVEGGRLARLAVLPASVSPLARRWASLDVSEGYGRPLPVQLIHLHDNITEVRLYVTGNTGKSLRWEEATRVARITGHTHTEA